MTGLQFIARIQTLHRNKPALLFLLDAAPLTGSMVLQSNVMLNRQHAATMKRTAQPAAPFSQQTHCSTSSTLLPTNPLLNQQHPSPNKPTAQPAAFLPPQT